MHVLKLKLAQHGLASKKEKSKFYHLNSLPCTNQSCGKLVNGTGGSIMPLSRAIDSAVPLHLLV